MCRSSRTRTEPGRTSLIVVDGRTRRVTTPAAAVIGGLAGFLTAVLLTYLPSLLAGTADEEPLTPLLVFSSVLVPLFAGAAALPAMLRRAREPRGTRRSLLATGAFLVLVAALWQLWAVMTGAPLIL